MNFDDLYTEFGFDKIDKYYGAHSIEQIFSGDIFANIKNELLKDYNALMTIAALFILTVLFDKMCNNNLREKMLPFLISINIIYVNINILTIGKSTIELLVGFNNLASMLMYSAFFITSKIPADLNITYTCQIMSNVLLYIMVPLSFLLLILFTAGAFSPGQIIFKFTESIYKIVSKAFSVFVLLCSSYIAISTSITAKTNRIAYETMKQSLGSSSLITGKSIAGLSDYILHSMSIISEMAGLSVLIGVISIILIPTLKIVFLGFFTNVLFTFYNSYKDDASSAMLKGTYNLCLYISSIIVTTGIMTILLSQIFLMSINAMVPG